MPTRADIQKEILEGKNSSQDKVRKRFLKRLERHTKRDTLVYASGYASAQKYPAAAQQVFSLNSQDVQGFMAALHGLKGSELDLIIHSPGGSLEASDQIVQYLRSKYNHIRAIIPQNAMSAATMLACACDELVMGKHSAIGPIDPQITFPTQHGSFTAPAQSLLDEFAQARSEVVADQKLAALWATKFKDYPPGILKICQDTLKLAVEKVEQWLASYMFAGESDGSTKANSIATWLGNARDHKTHGRPIGITTAASKGLKVSALEDDPVLQELVLSVYHALMVSFDVTNTVKVTENHSGKGAILQLEVKPGAVPK